MKRCASRICIIIRRQSWRFAKAPSTRSASLRILTISTCEYNVINYNYHNYDNHNNELVYHANKYEVSVMSLSDPLAGHITSGLHRKGRSVRTTNQSNGVHIMCVYLASSTHKCLSQCNVTSRMEIDFPVTGKECRRRKFSTLYVRTESSRDLNAICSRKNSKWRGNNFLVDFPFGFVFFSPLF